MEPQQKVTRSAARHLRRKRMNLARRAAEKVSSNTIHESVLNDNQESLKKTNNLQSNLILKPLSYIESRNNQSKIEQKESSNTCKAKSNKNPNSSESVFLSGFHSDAKKNTEEKIIKKEKLQVTTIKNENHPDDCPKMDITEKTREQIKAEREAKKAAKAASKTKGKGFKPKVPAALSNQICLSVDITAKVSTENASIVKQQSEDGKDEEKSKAELRAERRAKQEAQRAAKQQTLADKIKVKSVETKKSPEIVAESKKMEESLKKIVTKVKIVKEISHEVNLFKHLYNDKKLALGKEPAVNSRVHPAIVRLGIQYADKVVVGSNARCVALLSAVKELIQNYERPSQADFTRSLETCLQESVEYLKCCRPLAVSMQNALRHLKWQMSLLGSTISDKEAKCKLIESIDQYIKEQVLLAGESISLTIQTKISNGDVILTYGHSSLIHQILYDLHTAGKEFRVVIVDGRPWLEGRELLRKLVKHGIKCSYVLINALSFIMPEVSKVFIGAHAILANGAVMSRVGTAQVALMAKAFNVPVLVVCETHKSSERVHTDSIVYNELGNADELTKNSLNIPKKSCLANWRTKESLSLLNLTYDVTPADLVTAVVTEFAILPCTSVPVILRIKPSEI